MKKSIGVLAAVMIAFSALATTAPVYAYKACPKGSLQEGVAEYVTADGETATEAASISYDDTTGKVGAGTKLASKAQCNMNGRDLAGSTLIATIVVIIDVILGVLGIVAVAVIVLGGVTYTTSQGDPGKVKKAKDMILYGIIGLLVAILAFAIVNFVLSSILGSGSSSGGGSGVPTPSPAMPTPSPAP